MYWTFIFGLFGALMAAASGSNNSSDEQTSIRNAEEPPEQDVADTKQTKVAARTVAPDQEPQVSKSGSTKAKETQTEKTPTEVSEVESPPQTGTPTEVPEPGPVTLTQDVTAEVIAGRVTKFDLSEVDDVQSVKVLSGPEAGNLTVNPDNTLSLVLTGSEHTGALNFSYEVTHSNGDKTVFDADVDAIAGPQEKGWGTGEFYVLQEDDNGDMIIEHGDNHRKVFISNDDDALSRADIAALEGMKVEQITGLWLSQNPEYGGSEGLALKPDAGMELWYSITGSNQGPTSNWLLFERGFEYDDLDRLVARGSTGESELHPQLIGAYGEGDKPVLHTVLNMYQEWSDNTVIQGVALPEGAKLIWGENIILDNVSMSNEELTVKGVDAFTLRNSDITDVFRDEPVRDTDIWEPAYNRISGSFFDELDGLLLEGNFFDHNGWADGYSYDMSTDNPQSPSFYNHNIYIQNTVTDVTLRDNITMRASSFGATIRPGAFVEDNLFLDNNAALNALGGDYKDAGFIGNYSLLNGNVITSGAHKTVDDKEGALTMGAGIWGRMTTLLDNIVTHLSDPNNPADGADKEFAHFAVRTPDGSGFYDDTMIYNWSAERGNSEENADRNIEGLDKDVLDDTTIQLFTAALLGQPNATIDDLSDYLRQQYQGDQDQVVTADTIVDFFKAGFGLDVDVRDDAQTLRFVPNDLGDGVRWDNRLNWSTDDLPGTRDGDSVDLGGNWVNYGGTTTLEDLDFGDGGKLAVGNGYLEINDHIAVGDSGAEISIERSGQFWTNGYTDLDTLEINVAGGRFANTGLFAGSSELTVSDNAQALLATDGADFIVRDGSGLAINGSDVKVGFDGEAGGTGVLLFSDNATLSFKADEDGFGTIREFRSGHFDQEGSDIESGVNLGDVNLELDVSAIAGGGATTETLIRVDEVTGAIGSVDVVGLASNQNATVFVDYSNDIVTLTLGAKGSGSGNVSIETAGNETQSNSSSALWASLTNGHGIYADDPASSIPSEEDEDALVD